MMQAELARASRLTTMGQMAASIAHEINQPLAGVVNNANAGLRWLTNRPPNIDEVRAALRRIVNDGERGSGIIESIRAMLKKDDRKRVNLDLNELIRDVMRLTQGQFQKQGVSIRSELAENLSTVSADRVQLQQVILNLLMNAAEATASNSNRERLVCVRSEKHDGDWVRISVEDSGTGIKPEDEKRIFEAFFTTKADGMGMGLSICRSIVQSHGGRITAARAMPRGSVFQVILPAVGRSAASMKKQPTVEAVVYVIDDDASVRDSLKSLFGSVGLHVELFESADDFLQSQHPDVACCLVLDVRLPGLSGLEFQSELAKAGTDLPIIFMTGHGDIPMTVQAMKAGAVEFLTKPCRDQELLDAVRLAIERDRARRKDEKNMTVLKSQFASLTARENEILGFVTSGLLNKQIAAELGISVVTVKMHRGNIMRKMRARSLADLVRMADLLGVSRAKPTAP